MSIAEFAGLDVRPIGMPLRQFSASAPVSFNDLSISAANAAIIYIGQVFWTDHSSHTIDTTGSSSIGFRTGGATFANAGTTLKVGVAAVDTSNGPPGRASNTAGVINFDAVASLTGGGGGLITNGWNDLVPTSGTKAIANGDFVAVAFQFTARAGSDSVTVRQVSSLTAGAMPAVTSYTGSFTGQSLLPNCTLRASDGTYGSIYGGSIASTLTNSQAFNTGTTIKECGNLFKVPYPCKAFGAIFNPNAASGGDFDIVLYEDALGTPVSKASVSIDANTVSASGFAIYEAIFGASSGFGYQLDPTKWYAIVGKPTTANNLTMFYRTLGNSAHQAIVASGGANGYAVNRNTGAFAAQNSQLDRFDIGLLTFGGDTGAGSGGFGIIGS